MHWRYQLRHWKNDIFSRLGIRRRQRFAPGKTSDRPHRITIAMSALSAVTTLAALVFTFLGFRTSQSSLELSRRAVAISERNLTVAQRAYVSVRDGRFTVKEIEVVDSPTRRGFIVSFSFRLHNAGNTPARILAARYVVRVPPTWVDPGDNANDGEYLILNDSRWELGQRSEVLRDAHRVFSLTTPQALVTFRNDQMWELRQVHLIARIDYADVFDERHHQTWCWKSGREFAERSACGPTLIDKLPGVPENWRPEIDPY